MFDVCIIGSGPSAVISAKHFVKIGYKVCIVDSGEDIKKDKIQEKHFKEQINNDSDFFYPVDDALFDAESGSAQVTKAREYITKNVVKYGKIISNNFAPFQTLASGGLSAAWGAACFTYSENDLNKVGIDNLNYEEVAKIIGISGPLESRFCAIKNKQKPAIIDHNGTSILSKIPKGISLEQSSLATLTESLDNRRPNPYFDMDFYSNFNDATFRSIQILRELQNHHNFTHIKNALALTFTESDAVTIKYLDLSNSVSHEIKAKTLIVCAGAINSYRFIANSLKCFDKANPILCNPYLYIPTIHLPNLGKKGAHFRHSLSQVFGEIDEVEDATLQFYSYRSLLISRLMAQTPMPSYFSRLFWRSLVESLVIVGAHFVDDGKSQRYIKAKNSEDVADLEIDFPWPKITGVSKIITSLLKLKFVPMGVVKTKMGGSIHYAGTMPISKPLEYPIGMNENGLIHNTQNVYCFDSSGWKYLPSRGLTFTIMANAYRLAQNLK